MKRWNNLGTVETIFEEESDDLQSLSSPPLSPPLSSPFTPIHSSIDAWTKKTGRKPDVKIHVQGICFHLHKEPLIRESNYLKMHLIGGVTEFTLSPPLKITVDTFRQVADFCYSGHTIITPFNVAALRIAAELLGMNGDDGESDGSCGGESLRQRTEYYFCMVVAVNKDFTCSVLRSCLSLLPEAEKTAFLASRCIEALFSMDEDDDDDYDDYDGDVNGNGDGVCNGDGVVSCAEELKGVVPEDFRMIADSMQHRFTSSHDLLYRVVDLYFLVYDGSKISEEQKTQICTCIDCSILSSPVLMHVVQNPRMPLRFIVQAMLIEQINTHRTLFATLNSTTATTTANPKAQLQHQPKSQAHVRPNECPSTLGAILERDAALRQVAQLRSALETTSSRIETLEHELSRMKEALIVQSDKQSHNQTLLLLEQQSRRSSSCRFTAPNSNRVERGERGSVSASMLRFRGGKNMESSSSNLTKNQLDRSPKVKGAKKNFGQRLIWGLKSALRVSNNSKHKDVKEERKETVMSLNHDGFRAMLKALPSGNSHDK